MKAAVYIRVSTEDQAEHGVSLDVQRADCTARAHDLGAHSVEVYCDDGHTGRSMDRPAIQQLIGDMPRLDVIVIWRLDRLSRDIVDLEGLRKLCVRHQVALVGVREEIRWGTADDVFMYQFSGIRGQLESAKIAERVIPAMRRVLETGRWPTNPPLGYDLTDKHLVVNAGEAEIVREIFAMYADHESISQVTRELNRRGIPRRLSANQWTAAHVSRILRNPIYVGIMAWSGEEFAGEHEPLIDAETWRAVNDLRAVRERSGHRVSSHDRAGRSTAAHLRPNVPRSLAPVLSCGICGGQIAAQPTHQGRHPRYMCLARKAVAVEDRHAGVSAGRQKIDAVIWRQVELDLTGGSIRQAVDDIRRRRKLEGGRLEQLRAQLADVDAQLGRAVALAHQGVPESVIRAANAPLLQERAQILSAIDAAAEPPELGRWERVARISPQRLVKRLMSADVETQLGFLLGLFSEVRLWTGAVEFCYAGELLEPVRRALPGYYAPARGITDLGF